MKSEKSIKTGKFKTEYEIQQFILKRFNDKGLTSDEDPPIVGVRAVARIAFCAASFSMCSMFATIPYIHLSTNTSLALAKIVIDSRRFLAMTGSATLSSKFNENIKSNCEMQIEKIQKKLLELSIKGWLFYDFHNRDKIGLKILGLSIQGLATRRWCL